MLRTRRFIEHRHSAFGNAAILLFIAVQAADGVFTYLGVRVLGPEIEANPLLAWMMGALGEGPALALAKGIATTLGAALHVLTVHRVVAALVIVYLLGAIAPWTLILFFSPARLFF
ncbi:MAG: DUF5658 family protein [Vicinamibacterales bacterium]|jgi:hypothetical protein|nr:DUF5658 family protein [Vicinamibacterales bacterium]